MKEIYQIKCASDLHENEIELIIDAWSVPEFNELKKDDFVKRFSLSEFHLLYIDESILAIARMNFDFEMEIQETRYRFAELVGLVALQKQNGRGSRLVKLVRENMMKRNIQAIGFCEKSLRMFYQKCGIGVFEGKAKFIFEYSGNQWIASMDDDILEINLSTENCLLLESLDHNNPAFLYLA